MTRIWESWEIPNPAVDEAYQLLADAERQAKQEECAAQGHGERCEITSFGSPRREHLCGSCSAIILEDW